jgi:hypothetical protein
MESISNDRFRLAVLAANLHMARWWLAHKLGPMANPITGEPDGHWDYGAMVTIDEVIDVLKKLSRGDAI